MDANRRTFLKGLALTGFAAATPRFVSGKVLPDKMNSLKADTNPPIVALIYGLPDESAFLAGVRSARPQQHGHDSVMVQRCDLGLDFLQSLHALLHSGKPTPIIGLVDNASAAIITDLARSAGVRMHWLGQHAVSTEYARHSILTADEWHEGGLRLEHQLNARGVDFNFTEQPGTQLGGWRQIASSTARQDSQNGNWAASLGFVLASLAANPTAQPAAASGRAASTPVLGNFVSFSFKT